MFPWARGIFSRLLTNWAKNYRHRFRTLTGFADLPVSFNLSSVTDFILTKGQGKFPWELRTDSDEVDSKLSFDMSVIFSVKQNRVDVVMPWTYFPPFQNAGRQGATRESISHGALLTEY